MHDGDAFSITLRANEIDIKVMFASIIICTNYFFDNENPSPEKNSVYNNQWNGNNTFTDSGCY